MPQFKSTFAVPLFAVLAVTAGASSLWAQTTPPSAPPAPPPAVTAPAPIAPASPMLTAKELEGLAVFGSEGQQLGKVAKVNVKPDGNVKDVEVHSSGFLGFFGKTYIVPVEKFNKKGGRIELSMTSEQAKQYVR
ncbi:MAG: PRC-barrel domain-containing protein [Hyphomicrobiaceae bacterium]